MEPETSWYVKGRVGLVKASGIVSLQDLQAADRQMVEMIRQKSPDAALFHFLIDLRNVDKLEFNVAEMSRAFTHLHEPGLGWSLLITNNRLIKFVGSVVTQLAKARFMAFSTFDEALEFLQGQDSTLGALPPADTAN
jgi:hypothetical protein